MTLCPLESDSLVGQTDRMLPLQSTRQKAAEVIASEGDGCRQQRLLVTGSPGASLKGEIDVLRARHLVSVSQGLEENSIWCTKKCTISTLARLMLWFSVPVSNMCKDSGKSDEPNFRLISFPCICANEVFKCVLVNQCNGL